MDKGKRKKIEKTIYETFDRLDPTGDNTKHYMSLFKDMSDSQFEKYMKEFLYDDTENFYLETVEYERDITMDGIKNAANYLNVPLYEYVVTPYTNDDGIETVTAEPVPVGYIHMKRVQQMVAKKNTMSINIDKRQGTTGQVIGDDKNARISDMENIALTTIGAKHTIREYNHFRADNPVAKAEGLNKIKTDGFVSEKDISHNNFDKVALNTLDVYFTCAGVKTDLVTNNLLLPSTYKQYNKDKASISSKYINK